MKKDQFVIACLESPASADTVLPYARYCAGQLKKGIIVLNVSKDGQSDWLKQYGLPYVGLKGDWKTAIDGFPTAFGGVLAVVAVDRKAQRSSISNPATLLKNFADCKIAYLVVQSGEWRVESGTHLSTFLTLDYRRESKEKLIWGSYMVRFFGTKLTIATPAYQDAGLREKVNNNILFMKKIYKSLEVDYTLQSFKLPRLTTPDQAVLQTISASSSQHSNLLIAMTTDKRDRDLGDLIFGVPELKLITTAHNPILFLNQRDDLYVLCD